jgi:hypothetical protein
MKQSRIIELNGTFLGAAVSLGGKAGWQVVAAGLADGQVAASFQDASGLARQAFWAAQPLDHQPKAA